MSAVPYNSSVGGMYSTSPAMNRTRSTVLLSRPEFFCRCDSCTYKVRRLMESTIIEPSEPLMIPTLYTDFGWWNVRLPSKLLEPVVQFKSAGCVSINDDVMNFLEEKRVINWCLGLRQLHPIRTTGDGNCLMHAVILATCGIQDSGLILRRLVYVALVESTSNSFRERWEKEKQRLNESIPGGLQYTPEEWDKEWSMVVNAAEDLRTRTTMAYEFLEEMHVFVLANVIRRPIIILGESTVRSPLAGDAIEQNNFVGIYLPLLWPPGACDPIPVVLCFLHNHFQPLISRYKLHSEPKDFLAIPLVTSQLEPLHIHFLLPREEPVAHDLLQEYLLTTEVVRKSEDGRSVEAILVAEILYTSRYLKWERVDYLYVMEGLNAQMDAQKIAHGPSKSSYIQPGKGDKRVHPTSHDVKKPDHSAVECCHCRKMKQKSKTTQLDGSIGALEDSFGDGHTSKIQFNTSEGCTDRIHKNYSTGNLDSADWTKQLQLKQTKDLAAGVGQDGRHLAPGVESIPDNVVIFNTLKKLQSPQQTEVRPQTTVSPSTKPGNVKASRTPSAAEKSRSQPRRKLSDISDADIEYIKKKFTVKTPIYCRSLALLGKQCAKPDCNQFLADETDFCCLVHSCPPNPPPTAVVAKPTTTRCTSAGCLNLGLDHYNGLCARCYVYVMLGFSTRYEDEQRSQYSTWYDTLMSSNYKEDRDTKRSVAKIPLLQQSMTSSSSYGEGLVANKQQKCLPISPSSSESVKNLKSGKEKALTEGSTQSLMKSVTTEKFDPGHFHEFYENPDSRFIGEDFYDWFDKKYPQKVLGDGTLPPEPQISKILPFRDNMSVAQDKEKLKTIAKNDCTKNEDSVHGGDKQLTIVKENNKEGGSQKNALERSTMVGKGEETSKEDLGNHLPPVSAARTSRLGAKSEYCESSDDIGSMNAVLVYSREPKKGEWTLPSIVPDLVASGDICCDGEELPKCLNASCEHVAMDMVAGGYCAACHAVHGLGRTDAQTSGVADDVSHQPVHMPTQETIAPCVTEGCCNAVTIVELGLCSVCYARQLKASTTLQSPLQKTVRSANRYVTKTKETSQSSLTSSGLLTQRATRCLRSSCDRYGDPVYRGYCSQCATQFKKSPMEIDSCC